MKVTIHMQAGNELPYSNIHVTTEWEITDDGRDPEDLAKYANEVHRAFIGEEFKKTESLFVSQMLLKNEKLEDKKDRVIAGLSAKLLSLGADKAALDEYLKKELK